MVAMVPFDWQVHDTYFIVAHLHYVLIGGMVFPLFAGLYYWTPAFSRHRLDERIGKWAFWLMFIGFNVAFFTMHLTGLLGIPRRVYTYLPGTGWGMLNFISTVGAVVMAAGTALALFDLVRNFRLSIGDSAGNVWKAGTLEWLQNGTYSARSIPIVETHDPLWQNPQMSRDVERGAYYLLGTITGGRETIVTSPIEARPQYLMIMPMPSSAHLMAAVATAAFFLLLTFKLVIAALVFGAIAIAAVVLWAWDLDPPPGRRANIGGGVILPITATGPGSHSWWAMVVLMLVLGTLFLSLIFSYLYVWTVSPDYWPSADALAARAYPIATVVLLAISSGLMLIAGRQLPTAASQSGIAAALLMIIACIALLSSLAIETASHWNNGLRPEASSYGALVYLIVAVGGVLAGAVLIMVLFAIARLIAGMIDSTRRQVFDNSALLFHYVVAQTLLGVLLVHGFPRLVA